MAYGRRRRGRYGRRVRRYLKRGVRAKRSRLGGLSRLYRNRALARAGGASALMYKQVDVSWQATKTVYNTAGITPELLNGTKEGSGFYNRIGRTICMKYLSLKLTLFQNAVNTLIDPIVRILIVYDAQANGSTPTYADIIKSYDNNGGNTSLINDGLNPDNRDRFKFIFDKFLELPRVTTLVGPDVSGAPTMIPSNACQIRRKIPLRGLETKYNAATEVAGSIQTGSLWLIVATNDTSVGPVYQYGFSTRLVFTN